MNLKNFILFTFCFFLLSGAVNATLYRGAEITYVHISGLTYGITINTCTKTSSVADRPYLDLDMGDGVIDSIPRIQVIYNTGGYDGQQNVYYLEHTYPGPGIYTITLYEANRVQGIINIPGSVNEPISVQATIVISPFLTPNNSVQFNDFPCSALGCLNNEFCYLPLVYDPDGDSLSFELIPCGGDGVPISSYVFPNFLGGTFTLDSLTGEICWDAPVLQGDYNVALKISEWRNLGNNQFVNMGDVIRDMQISIFSDCATMGFEENNLTEVFSVYPNPAHSLLSISSTLNNKSEIKVFSSSGKLVYVGTLDQNVELDISNWSNGLYFISISHDNKIWSQKFIKD